MFFAPNFVLPCLPLQFTSKFLPCLRAASSHVSVNFHDNKKDFWIFVDCDYFFEIIKYIFFIYMYSLRREFGIAKFL